MSEVVNFSAPWLDVVVFGLIVVFAIAGYGRGLLRTIIWALGVIAGALVGLVLLPQAAQTLFDNSLLIALLSFSGTVGGAIMGGIGGGIVARLIRPVVLPLGILRFLDHLSGAIIGGIAMAVVVWLVASSVLVERISQLEPLPQSRAVIFVEQYLPAEARGGLIVLVERFGLPVEIEAPAP